MRLKNTLTVLMVLTGLLGKGQSVLDGVYVNEHIPTKKDYRVFIYPVDLRYEFLDTLTFLQTLDHYFVCNAKVSTSPVKGMQLINYPYQLGKEMHKKNTLKNCKTFLREEMNTYDRYVETVFPSFLKYDFLDAVNVINEHNAKRVNVTAGPFLRQYLEPFYMKNTEVTNNEYRQFVAWVKDSIARELLINAAKDKHDWGIETIGPDGKIKYNLDWNAQLRWNDPELVPILNQLYLPENQRYYRRKEINTKKLVYSYNGTLSPNDTVAIYPDTLCHLNQVFDLYNDPKTNMYFWHPAFDGYPVVGLNIAQINAFLHWKTKMHNQENYRKGKKETVSYELPGQMEWELASAQQELKKITAYNYRQINPDLSYQSDLVIQPFYEKSVLRVDSIKGIPHHDSTGKRIDYYQKEYHYGLVGKDFLHAITHKQTERKGNGYYETIGPYKTCESCNQVTGLNNNVSEWIKTTDTAFLHLRNVRWNILDSYKHPDLKDLVTIEKIFAHRNDSGTQLVRGANWTDEKASVIEGINAKCFADPKGQYATVGFRYVMRVKFIE